MYDKNKAIGNDPNNVFIEGTYLLHVLSYIEASILGLSGIYPVKQMAQKQKQIRTHHQCTLCQKHFFGGLCTHRTKPWFVSLPIYTSAHLPVQGCCM